MHTELNENSKGLQLSAICNPTNQDRSIKLLWKNMCHNYEEGQDWVVKILWKYMCHNYEEGLHLPKYYNEYVP